jgi:thiamine kinase-like enzyme
MERNEAAVLSALPVLSWLPHLIEYRPQAHMIVMRRMEPVSDLRDEIDTLLHRIAMLVKLPLRPRWPAKIALLPQSIDVVARHLGRSYDRAAVMQHLEQLRGVLRHASGFFTHNDLVASNVMLTEDGPAVFDFAEAALGVPHFDAIRIGRSFRVQDRERYRHDWLEALGIAALHSVQLYDLCEDVDFLVNEMGKMCWLYGQTGLAWINEDIQRHLPEFERLVKSDRWTVLRPLCP